MASGQQVARENVQKFAIWAASKTDAEFRSMVVRGALSRTDIAAECGFGKSALGQNPLVRDALKTLEDELRDRGVLPPRAEDVENAVGPAPARAQSSSTVRDVERLKRLEQENASLRAELEEVKRALRKYAALQEALDDSGRLPR